MQNPSVFLYGPGNAKIQESSIPTVTDPNDTLIRIQFVGVCGSDVHFWNHGGVGDHVVSQSHPLIMGHEACGTVEAVGSSVTNIKAGDNVAIEPCFPCRICVRCKEGHYNLCPRMKFAACPPDTNGMLTKWFKVPADFCYQLPDHVTLEEGVMAEPLAVAAHAVKMAGIRPGQSVVIFGSGTIGLLCGVVARYFGARKIIAVDIADSKLEFARNFDGRATFKPSMEYDAKENASCIVEENGLGLGADAAIEASGAESSVNTAVYVLRPGGHCVQTGLGKPIINFPILTMSEKELHMHGAFRYGPDDYQVALDVLESRTVPIKTLISQVFDFEKTTDAWEATKAGRGIKNMIRGPQG